MHEIFPVLFILFYFLFHYKHSFFLSLIHLLHFHSLTSLTTSLPNLYRGRSQTECQIPKAPARWLKSIGQSAKDSSVTLSSRWVWQWFVSSVSYLLFEDYQEFVCYVKLPISLVLHFILSVFIAKMYLCVKYFLFCEIYVARIAWL